MLKHQFGDVVSPFTPEERVNIALGKMFFWWFLDNIFIKSFEGQVYTHPETGEKVSFEFSSLHREWAILAQVNPRICMQAPRAHLKTTVMGQAYAFWRMFKADNNELMDGMYFSYNETLASEKMNLLKRIIVNNPYCRHWKDLKSTSSSVLDFLIDWGDGPVAEATFKGAGIKSATRGRHPKVTLCDDILSDFSNPLSSADLRLINRIFRQAIMSLPANPDDILFLIGTPQSYDDILYQLASDEDWLWLVYPAVSDWKEKVVQWPEKFDFDRLMRIRRSIKAAAFEVEYQLTPIILTDQFFTRGDVMSVVDLELGGWDLDDEFDNSGQLGIYGGMDVGKQVHPSHVTVFLELPNQTLIQLYQTFLDHMPYPQQVKVLNSVAKRFNMSRGYYDATYNVLDDRGLNRRWIGKPFTKKLKADMATGLERRIFAEVDEPGIILLNDVRMVDQMTAVRKDLTAPDGPGGHGDSFWSVALGVRAADDGPTMIDMGSPTARLIAASPRDTAWRQLGARK